MSGLDIVHDANERRFAARTEHGTARLEYELVNEDTLDLAHTFVPEEDRGRGIAARMVEYAFTYASDHGLSVIPTCPYVRSWLKKNPGFESVAVEG